MKGKRAHKADGGINGKTGGTDDAEMDEKTKPEKRVNSKIEDDAEELKKGGRAKRKFGGKTEVGEVKGEMKHHAGRKPRKSGGRSGSDMSPFSSARKGTPAPGRKEMMESDG